MLQQGRRRQPAGDHASREKMPEGGKQLTIAIKADGDVFVGQIWVPGEHLEVAS